MFINLNEVYPSYNFCINGTSYAGEPKNNTAMYVTGKVQKLLEHLEHCKECLIYVEEGIVVPDTIRDKNAVLFSKNPELEFARFAERLMKLREEEEAKLSYQLTEGGFYISENTLLGRNVTIGPGCVIGPGVTIGDNAVIYPGCIIKHAVIGNNFVCNENAVIGSYSFTMAEEEDGNKYRIPSMGIVRIGNDVEVGSNDNIACGSCGDTVIEDYVKLDALIHIGHDAHLCKNVEITAGVTVSGFVHVGEAAYFGVGCAIRNRITIGANSIIGMGSVVTKMVEEGLTVVGNPARLLTKSNH